MGVNLLERWRNEEILEEAKVELTAVVMRRRLEWVRENIRAVMEIKMKGSALDEDLSSDVKTLSEGT